MNILKESFTQKNQFLRLFTSLICEGAENHLTFAKEKPSNLKETVKRINSWLSKGKKSNYCLKSALIELISLLPQCPQSVLTAEGETWLQLCLRNLSHPDFEVVTCLVEIMVFILKSSEYNKELNKKLSKQSLMLVERLHKCHISIRVPCFKCLYENLRFFPHQALAQRKYIEIKLMKILSSPLDFNYDLIYAGASVYAALPVPGGGGTSTAEMRGDQLEQLISLSHHAADAVFYDIKECEKYKTSRDHKLPIETIEAAWELKMPSMRILTSAIVLGNCFEFIKIFFEKCPTQFVRICPKSLINIVFRVLQVELQSLRGKDSVEVRTLFYILPSLYSRALSLLQSLIKNNICSSSMVLIEEQLVLILKSTKNMSCDPNHVKHEGESGRINQTKLQPFIKIRIQCYKALTEAVKIDQAISGNYMEDLVSSLKADIQPIKDTLSLKQATPGGSLSLLSAKKKSKKKGYSVTSDQCHEEAQDVPVSSAVTQKIPLTISALKFIEALFTYTYQSCPLMYVQKIQNELFGLLKTRRSGIYGDARVRDCLFRAVTAIFLHPHPLSPPQFNFLSVVFREEKQHSREQVSETVERGLSLMGFIASNPSTVKWSDYVNLNKACLELENKEIKARQESEEPLLNGHISDDDESGMSDFEVDEPQNDVDEPVETRSLFLDLNDDLEMENVRESEESETLGINEEDKEVEFDERTIDNDLEEYDKIEKALKEENDLPAEEASEDDLEDNEEDSFSLEMNSNDFGVDEDKEEDEDDDSNSNSEADDDEWEELLEKEFGEKKEEKNNNGLKRRNDSSSSGQVTKRNKIYENNESDDDSTDSVNKILATFVDADPDTDTDSDIG